ncbi:MAG: ADP-ribosylation factor-like protein [Patescibacteria group bacterium]|nr:ADP-ribosylation factor-like protein [Patescibacteria group bacterium]
MERFKKVVLVGPPNSGKTTIKKVFFNYSDPSNILKEPLIPTRGCDVHTFNILKKKISFFDLAGQENKRWITEDSSIFNQSDLIICVFEIQKSLEEIVLFLEGIRKVIEECNLKKCPTCIFLHKIDLRPISYSHLKKKNLIKSLIQFPLKFYKVKLTSIEKEYFYPSYYEIIEILNILLDNNQNINQLEIDNLKTSISIILDSEISKTYDKDYIIKNYKLTAEEIIIHLKRLVKLGFLQVSKDFQIFKMTNRGDYFKKSFLPENINVDTHLKFFNTLTQIIPEKMVF